MKCRKFQKQFSLYRDQMLQPLQKEAVDAHLKSCSRCSEAWQFFKRALSVFSRREKVQVPPQVWVHFRMNLEKGKQEERWWKEEARTLGWWGATAVSAAILLLLWNWTASYQQEENLALRSFLTKSQFGKVLVVF